MKNQSRTSWSSLQERQLLKTVKQAENIGEGLKTYQKQSGRGYPGILSKYYSLLKDKKSTKTTRKRVKQTNDLPFEVKIEQVQLSRVKNNPYLDALKQQISGLEKGYGFQYPKEYHNSIQNILSKLHKQKNGPGYGTVRVNSQLRRIGRIF